jgi:hypothetical protein
MTCIVAITEQGKVWMGGDGVGWCNSIPFPHDNGKVFRLKDVILGSCGDRRFSEIVRFCFQPPGLTDGDLAQYMAIAFTDALRASCRERGYVESNNGRDSLPEGDALLIGIEGKLFYLSQAFSCSGILGDYYAIGCGKPVALGALSATVGEEPEARITKALKAAEEWDDGVRGPVTILSVETPGSSGKR